MASLIELGEQFSTVNFIGFRHVRTFPFGDPLSASLPRNSSEEIDIEERIHELLSSSASEPSVAKLLASLRASTNGKSLAGLADAANKAIPYLPGSSPSEELATAGETDDIIADCEGNEGAVIIREHRVRERNRKLITVAKQKFKQRFGKLFCECCGIDFAKHYPSLGDDFIEAHHRVPLHQLDAAKKTRAEDLAMLGSNCHRMVHKTTDISTEVVQDLLIANGTFIDESNLLLLGVKIQPATNA